MIFRYFPSLSKKQIEQFDKLGSMYREWNSRINVISRKDMDNFCLHHVLHSLAIAKVINFVPGSRILDVGTGGGFPGIPLAIMFPCSQFSLLDSIEKKIRVVSAVSTGLGLTNVSTIRKRAEEEKGMYDFVVSRAVTAFPAFVSMTRKNISRTGRNSLMNGIIYLKGGDLTEDLKLLDSQTRIWNISDFFPDPFFETKKIIYLPV
jgi:16S rRNA (guanine527-N7)-methyltransferase